MKRAIVFGGTGTIGSRVVRRLGDEEVDVAFTYFDSEDDAQQLAKETGADAVQLDLADDAAIAEVVTHQMDQGVDALINCAASAHAVDYQKLTTEQLDEMLAVNVRGPMLAMKKLGPHMVERGGGDVVLLGALAPGQSLPIPSGFATTQGALSAYAMALAKECAGDVRVNVISSGLLEEGLSEKLADDVVEDYLEFSALRRLGDPEEIAEGVVWLALHNSYLNGKVVPVNGGI